MTINDSAPACYLRNMQVDVLIIGQGISGSMLSWFLNKEGKTFLIIDENGEQTSSAIAAGVINPVTGRRYVTTWMIDDLLSFARSTYAELSDYFDAPLIYHKNIIDFFPSPQMRNAFVDRVAEDPTYLRTYPDQNDFNKYFHYDFGCGEVCPVYVVDMSQLIILWRRQLLDNKMLLQEKFDLSALHLKGEGVRYKNIDAEKIIFCDGISAANNPLFEMLPFSANKGECLIIETENLPTEYIYKKGVMLVPMPQKNHYWVGSSYQWEYENDQPTTEFYTRTTALLQHWLKVPFKVVDHKAAVRPATLERRPFVGFHPAFPSLGILNGMGTKGASLAPYFAHQLVQHIKYGLPLAEEANINRFHKILSK